MAKVKIRVTPTDAPEDCLSCDLYGNCGGEDCPAMVDSVTKKERENENQDRQDR